MVDVKPLASSTPILDSGVLPPRRKKGYTLGFIIGLLISILFGVVVFKVADTQDQGDLAIASLFAAFIVVVTIHEIGHTAAGWFVGFHFSSIAIGPIQFGFEYGKLKFRVLQGASAGGFAGIHIDRVRRLRHRLLIFIIAGPLANLVSGILSLFLLKYVAPSSSKNWMVPMGTGFAYLSLLIGIINLIPMGSKLQNDGTRIWTLLNSYEKARRWISAIALAKESQKGVPLRLWKRTWLKAASSLKDESYDEFLGNWIAYIAANGRKDIPELTARLERCLALSHFLSTPKRDEIAREAAILSAWYRNDAETADKWLTQRVYPKNTTQLIQIRTRIALACARREFTEAFSGLKEGTIFIDALPDTPFKKTLREGWKEWEGEVKERADQPVGT